MLKIRLRRTGAKKQPSYRIVVTEANAPRDGRFIEILGHYDPKTNPSTIVLDAERASYWLSNGAQPTDVVAKMLKDKGVTAKTAAPEAPAAANA